ncbi:cyclic nucleotide-gated cation channel beta-1-like [Plectropomus leopardus]|uniref:cyclic nucleotide-gated cation channel beta-1-like n=1 Tax=Plectropomus leopardus TaxID=160734 RepID=UPI001C4C3D4F|nr:cyclic nucleotide-gated cation channel beta-1-like [Plectropomus leopardus]
MIAWISQGLEKVVPKPELSRKETAAAEPPAEVRRAAAETAAELQAASGDGGSHREDKTDSKPPPPRMMDWIKQGIEKVVPQPELHVCPKTDDSLKSEAAASSKVQTPAPEPPPAPKPAADSERSSKEAEQQPNMMGWIVSGLGRMLPQPVQKQESGSEEVQSISIVQKKTDLVLEDVGQDEDKEVQQKEKEAGGAEPLMDQCAPLVDSIKEEVGEAVLARMEEK